MKRTKPVKQKRCVIEANNVNIFGGQIIKTKVAIRRTKWTQSKNSKNEKKAI